MEAMRKEVGRKKRWWEHMWGVGYERVQLAVVWWVYSEGKGARLITS